MLREAPDRDMSEEDNSVSDIPFHRVDRKLLEGSQASDMSLASIRKIAFASREEAEGDNKAFYFEKGVLMR